MERVVIFDFDGVLADSRNQLYQLVRAAFDEIGIDLSQQQYFDFYLQNVKLAEKQFVGDKKKFSKLQKYIQEHGSDYYKSVKLFSFTEKLVTELSSFYKLAIVSSTKAGIIVEKLSTRSLGDKFYAVLGAESEMSKKKKLRFAFKEADAPQQGAFFVSDTVGDIKEGKEMGLIAVAVTWGYHSKPALVQARPDYIVNTPEELITCIKSV